MSIPLDKLTNDLKSIAGVIGIAIVDRNGTPVALDGIPETGCAQIASASTTLSEVARALEMGNAIQTLIIGSSYRILTFECEQRIVSVYMTPGASIQALKSKISNR